jgi:hypothetical protein
MPKTHINAIHEDDARALLERLGVAERHDDGTLLCGICGNSVRDSGIGAVRRLDDEIVFACSRLDCVRELS